MAEVFGVVAGIFALSQLAAKVTFLSHEYIKGVKGAPDDVRKFMDELNSLIKVLNALQGVANTNPGSTALKELSDRDGPLRGCIQELENLLLKLERKEVKFSRKILERVKWPLKKKETLEFVSRIERHKSLLILALNVDQMAAQNSDRQKDDILRTDAKRTEVLNWLYQETTDKRHTEISGRRQKNTGQWILGAPEVQGWAKKNSNSRLLWGYGIPGAGKTFLCSRIIDNLQDQAPTEHYGVAHIYFNYKEQGQQRLIDVLCSLVKQLACQVRRLPKEIEDLYDKLEPKQKAPTPQDLYAILLVVANSFAQTFVICDALDECDRKTQRKELLPLFHRMAKDGINLFLTSRHHPEDIQDSFRNSTKIKLWAKEDDITNYIEQKINENPRVKRLVEQGKFKERIIAQLKDCAKGMFLLVHFHIECLCQQTTVRQIVAELERLKTSSSSSEVSSLDATYSRAIENIRAQPKNCSELALRILSWLVKAQRVLTVHELQQALSVEQGSTTFDELGITDRRTLLDVCAGLLAIDEEGDTVRLVHYTLQEYLHSFSIIPEDADLKLSMACITFLSFDVFSEGACGPWSPWSSWSDRISLYPFLDYAARQLPLHLKSCSATSLKDSILKFLGSPGAISSFTQAFYIKEYRYPLEQTQLHIAVILGQCSIAKWVLEDAACDINSKDSYGETALHKAAYRGRDPVVQLLLEKGADPSAVTSDGWTTLHWAANGGYDPVVQLLLAKGVDPSAATSDGWTALHMAANGGHEPVVQLLLAKGVDPSAATSDGWTALHMAANGGHEPVVQLLLAKGVDPLAVTSDGWTTLHWAANGGYEPVVQLLLAKGVDPLAVTSDGWTALHMAANGGHEPVAQLLLAKGVDPSAATSDGWTALHMAAYRGHDPVVQLLLAKGVDPSAVTSVGETALHMAAYRGHESVVQLLLAKGVDPSAATSDGETALHKAAHRGHEPVVQLLLAKGVDPSAATRGGETALHKAAHRGYEPVVQLLLAKGVDPSTVTSDGETALHIAAKRWHYSVVKLLKKSSTQLAVIEG